MKTFAAIDVGSYALEMKLFEMTSKGGIKLIESIRHQIDLGTDTYVTGRISNSKIDEMCRILKEFKDICDAMKIDDYRLCATSAIRGASNSAIIMDRIKQRSGFKGTILSNSEQRFLHYKAVAYRNGKTFDELLNKTTAILDIGGSSTQISLFENGNLVTTQNLILGILRLAERMAHLNVGKARFEDLLGELIDTQLLVFRKLYLKDVTIQNLILVDDYISDVYVDYPGRSPEVIATEDTIDRILDILRNSPVSEICRQFNIPEDNVTLCHISAKLIKSVCELSKIDAIWIPGVTLGDGMAYEYAESHKLISKGHNFEEDILSSARTLGKRYLSSKKRSDTLESISLAIFDAMGKLHGMNKRDRLLLRISTILHDCGKFISMMNLGECSYNIIMNSEIIGLSHMEREIVANVVKYNHQEYSYTEVRRDTLDLDSDAQLTIAKLIAILRLANGLDRSHKQKFKDVKITVKNDELVFTVNDSADISLEKGLFTNRAEFFDEVFSIHPVIRRKSGK